MAYTDQKSPHLTHVSDIFGFSMENYAIYNVAVLSWVPLSGELLLLYKTRLCVAFFFYHRIDVLSGHRSKNLRYCRYHLPDTSAYYSLSVCEGSCAIRYSRYWEAVAAVSGGGKSAMILFLQKILQGMIEISLKTE